MWKQQQNKEIFLIQNKKQRKFILYQKKKIHRFICLLDLFIG